MPKNVRNCKEMQWLVCEFELRACRRELATVSVQTQKLKLKSENEDLVFSFYLSVFSLYEGSLC